MLDEFVLIHQIQEFFGPGAKPVFRAFNTMWGLGLGQLLPAIIFWLGARKMGYRAGLFTDISGVSGEYAKWLVTEPRPFYVSDAFAPLKVSTGFGMPSGNAQGIATLMVTISLYARRMWLWILATILILCVGLARVYFGVHSPSQVLVGWLAGIAIALLLFRIAEPFTDWFGKRSILFQVALVLVMSLLLTLTGLAINQLVLQHFVIPDAWIERYNELAIATDEEDAFTLFSPNESYVIGAYMFGLGIAGILLLRDLVPETGTGAGKTLNVVLGLGLYYGFPWCAGFVTDLVRETVFFWPWLMLYIVAIPLMIYVVTPMATACILAATKSAGVQR